MEDTIVAAIVLVITIVTWLYKLVANKAGQQAPPVASRQRPPVRPRDDKLQREIDVFLQETGAKKVVRPSAPQAAAQAPPGPARKPARSAAAPQQQRGEKRERPAKESVSRRKPDSQTLGTGVQSAVKQFSTKVAEEASPPLPHKVDELVAQHFGAPASSAPQADAALPISRRVVEMLRAPENLRQAMALNLVLSPPLASRRRQPR